MVSASLLVWPLLALVASTPIQHVLDTCPGYTATNVEEHSTGLTADLTLAGAPCNTYGTDIRHLKLEVEYQTDKRLHVIIYDADEQAYQVPESVFPRPSVEDRPGDNKKILSNSSGSNLVFQSQYVNLRTSLPQNPNLYGLGEHSDPLRLNITNYTRTLWNRDAYTIPAGTNLYGAHPVYVDHRRTGTHGVFLLNSNGMDVKIDKYHDGAQYLEYNLLGDALDLYFLAGPSPKDVSMQYAEVAGLPAMVPYWGFGFHQCRYGYRDRFEVASVVNNYSQANIPLETMWTDIDCMGHAKLFTLDQQRFPLQNVHALVNYLHEQNMHYIVMVDPAVSHSNYPSFTRGVEQDVFLRKQDGSLYQDWLHPNTLDYWRSEFAIFFNPETGMDINALWIDMNEAANFCYYPCLDLVTWALENNFPREPLAARPNPSSLPKFPDEFQTENTSTIRRWTTNDRRQEKGLGERLGLQGRNLIDPPYRISNAAESLSNFTINTDLIHANGLVKYDTHNLYGTMMSSLSRQALLHRRPGKRPLVITRSTFAGAGSHVAHWLGDNASTWEKYRISLAQMLAFASIFQIPFVGSDTCGFAGNTNKQLCSRWAMLGEFNPFYRNHNEASMISQEFYRWESVAEAARKAIALHYQLLDCVYTLFYRQTQTGEPWLLPLFFAYPDDPKIYGIDLQIFTENSTSVDEYLPDDIFYGWLVISLIETSYSDIPVHVRGGRIVPIRANSANTTTELWTQPFHLVIAPGLDGRASRELYMDDGDSLGQLATLEVFFVYGNSRLSFEGVFTLNTNLEIESVVLLGREMARA
ncbi:glycosyl hydrolases family 31-domain-containing protein [Aspergillus heterothallicus]